MDRIKEEIIMTHAVEVGIVRYYKVYVDDPDDEMTTEEIERLARGLAADEDELTPDPEIGIAREDVVSVKYQYDI